MSTKIEKLNKRLNKEKEKVIICEKNENKEILDKCKYEFDKYQNEECYYYGSINDLYNYIKGEYIKKMNNKNFNIEIERLRIEKSLGKHKKISEKLSTSNIALMTSIITVSMGALFALVQELVKSDYIPWYVAWSFIIIVISILVRQVYKSYKDSNFNERDLVNYISLKVLNDIENEIIE